MLINYEFHITLKDVNKEKFLSFCRLTGLKPILLELQNNKNIVILNDIMTSHHKLLSSDKEAFKELKTISFLLKKEGFSIVREKIEADINHPDLIDSFNIANSSKYFETHFNILTDDTEKEKLQEIAKKSGCHFSRNIFKKVGKKYTIMITFRKYTGNINEFKEDIHSIEEKLLKNSFKIEKTIVEYAIFDTREDWDKAWLSSTQG